MPKSLYITSSDEDVDKERSDEALLGPDAIYHTAYAVKDFPHEVHMLNTGPPVSSRAVCAAAAVLVVVKLSTDHSLLC